MSRSRFWLNKGSVERAEGWERWATRARQAPSWECLPLGRQVAQKRKLLLCPEAEGAPRKASLGLLGPQPETQPLFFLERHLEPPVQRFRNALLLGWLVLCATGVTTQSIVQAPPGNPLREVLPRYEAAKRWITYCVQGRLSRLPRVWMRSTAASSWPSLSPAQVRPL